MMFAKRFLDARPGRASTPHDARRDPPRPPTFVYETMSRAAHDDRVYALFDVPGTGFRDREGTPMFTQYHKMGWQKDFRSEDSPENQYDLTCNPVVVLGLPQDLDVGSIRAQCETRFGAVARVHRPRKVVTEPSNRDANDPPRAFESFAVVEFADGASAADAIAAGKVAFVLEARDSERHREESDDLKQEDREETADDKSSRSTTTTTIECAVAPRKTLVADVNRWRRDVRASFREASDLRLPFRNVGPNADPTDWCNAGNNFKRTFPELASFPK
jgi:hypothetical protein